MISINNLTYLIGDRALYNEASLHIKPGEHIGLIGKNGMGKSTLLKIINGDYTADSGEIQKSNNCTIGFLNQDLLSFQSDDSILSVAMEAFQEQNHIQKQIDEITKEMETNYKDSLLDRLTKLQERFEILDGYTIQAKTEEILEGLGFTTNDLQRPLREFSGGWRMRVILAKMLLAKPDLLMLDEPTNHLDLPSIEWLESYLQNYPGTFILVSHDQYFLDNTINKIIEVHNGRINSYSGNYTYFLNEKELREEIQHNAFINQQQKIKQTEKFIERFRAKATKARQVQSKVKSLEKMDFIDDVEDDNPDINIKFSFDVNPGKVIYTLLGINKSYGENMIFDDAEATIDRGDKIALIGANGKGKSTLLRIIDGSEEIASGEVEEGYNINASFYAQHQLESLNINNAILDELLQAGSGKTELELRTILGCFLFQGDDVFKKIKVLSGGEKSRVALAKTLISKANFLLLDEPTNHLDMTSVNIIIQALRDYEGSFVVVSHNRYFVENIANKIWYIEDGKLKEYPGNYAEYNWWLKNKKPKQETVKTSSSPKKEKKEKPRLNDNDNKKLKNEIKKIELSIEELESKKATIEEELAKPSVYSDHDLLAKHTSEIESINKSLEELNSTWEQKYEELENE